MIAPLGTRIAQADKQFVGLQDDYLCFWNLHQALVCHIHGVDDSFPGDKLAG